MSITITNTKAGKEYPYSIDEFNALPDVSKEYIIKQGITKSLDACCSDIEGEKKIRKDNPSYTAEDFKFALEESRTEAAQLVSKRWESILAGTVNTKTFSGATLLERKIKSILTQKLGSTTVKDLKTKGQLKDLITKIATGNGNKAQNAIGTEAQRQLDSVNEVNPNDLIA